MRANFARFGSVNPPAAGMAVCCMIHLMCLGSVFGQSSAQPAEPKPPQEASPGKVAAKLIVLRAAESDQQEIHGMSAALGAMKGVFRVAVFDSDKCVAIFASADSPVTVERSIRYLDLAGYTVSAADEEVYAKIEAVLRSQILDIPAPAGSCTTPMPAVEAQPDVQLTALGESVEPLREAFNTAAGTYRFVALLSPT